MRGRNSLAGLASLMIGLGGCGSSGVTCSSDDVTAIVKRIGKKQLAANPSIGLVFDLDKTSYEVNNIVTTETVGTRCFCKGEFTITWELSADAKRMKQDPVSWNSFKWNTMPGADEPTLTLPVEYEAQPTDDGRSIVVNASGF